MNAALNVFQRLFQTWEAVHPYNAAQVVRWRGQLSPARAAEGWEDALDAMGLGRVRVEKRKVFHESLNGELKRYPIRVLPDGADFQDFLSDELNRRFTDPDEPPFRAFIKPAGDSTWMGIVYRHWVADSVSIRLVLREWCERAYGVADESNGALHLAAPAYWELFGSRTGKVHVEHTLLDLWRAHQRFRSVLKVHSWGQEDYPVRVMLRDAPHGLIDSVRAYAKKQEITVGDVLLAALVDAAASFIPVQHRPTRRDLAVGNVVDLRPYASRDLSDTFGLYLGFTYLILRPADLKDWNRLLRTVHRQGLVLRPKVAQASTIWSGTAMAVQKVMQPGRVYHFYRKELPIAAGLSNVNLAGTWAANRHPEQVLDYLRISPTGPMIPAVLSTTTLGNHLQLGFTYRQALLNEPQAGKMMQRFIDRLADASQFAR